MAEEEKDVAQTKGSYVDCALSWLKVVDDWSVGGYKNTFPRLYYVVAGLVIAVLLL